MTCGTGTAGRVLPRATCVGPRGPDRSRRSPFGLDALLSCCNVTVLVIFGASAPLTGVPSCPHPNRSASVCASRRWSTTNIRTGVVGSGSRWSGGTDRPSSAKPVGLRPLRAGCVLALRRPFVQPRPPLRVASPCISPGSRPFEPSTGGSSSPRSERAIRNAHGPSSVRRPRATTNSGAPRSDRSSTRSIVCWSSTSAEADPSSRPVGCEEAHPGYTGVGLIHRPEVRSRPRTGEPPEGLSLASAVTRSGRPAIRRDARARRASGTGAPHWSPRTAEPPCAHRPA